MSRFQSQLRVQIDDGEASETLGIDGGGRGGSIKLRPAGSNVTEDQEPFMGVKVRRKASRHRDYRGDYVDVPSRPYLMKILDKQGDSNKHNLGLVWFGLVWFDEIRKIFMFLL